MQGPRNYSLGFKKGSGSRAHLLKHRALRFSLGRVKLGFRV